MLVHDRDRKWFPQAPSGFRTLMVTVQPFGDREPPEFTIVVPPDRTTRVQDPEPVQNPEEIASKDSSHKIQRRWKKRGGKRPEPFFRMMEQQTGTRLDIQKMRRANRGEKIHCPLVPGDQQVLAIVDRVTGLSIHEGKSATAQGGLLFEKNYRVLL